LVEEANQNKHSAPTIVEMSKVTGRKWKQLPKAVREVKYVNLLSDPYVQAFPLVKIF